MVYSKFPVLKNTSGPKEEFKWYAIYTMYKSEKLVAAHLRRKSIEVYVPLITKTRRYQKRIKTYQVPLINCYVFVRISTQVISQVLETEHVLKFIKQGKDLNAIPQFEIDILKKIEGIDLEVSSRPSEFSLGDMVEISQGTLAGLKGKLIRQAGKKHFIVELDAIGVELQINIDTALLRKIKNVKELTA
jgi:transcription antitermination factor NusG